VPVCVFVSMITPEPLRDSITKFSVHYSVVERVDESSNMARGARVVI